MIEMQQSHARLWSIITALLFGAAGLFLFLGGAELLVLGGSWFYALVGAVLLGTAAAGFRKPQLAARVYAGLLVVATLWLWLKPA